MSPGVSHTPAPILMPLHTKVCMYRMFMRLSSMRIFALLLWNSVQRELSCLVIFKDCLCFDCFSPLSPSNTFIETRSYRLSVEDSIPKLKVSIPRVHFFALRWKRCVKCCVTLNLSLAIICLLWNHLLLNLFVCCRKNHFEHFL